MTPLKLLRSWHLCSLDAPTVAVVWTWFVSTIFDFSPPFPLYCAMFFGVWGLYILDRILDATPLFRAQVRSALRDRREFHKRNFKPMMFLFVVCTLASANFAVFLPLHLLLSYLVTVALIALYFALIHLSQNNAQIPKELVVGIFFSAAVCLPSMKLHFDHLSNAMLLGGLATLNGFFIQNWEGEGQTKPHAPAIALVIICIIQAVLSDQAIWKLPTCMAISLMLFLILHGLRRKIDALTLRSCADFVLLTPLFFCIYSA